jgi:hypothetical protein
MADGPFQVQASEVVMQRFRDLVEQAHQQGRAAEALAAAERLLEGLRIDPLNLGESRGDLPHLNLQLRIVFEPPWCVHFAVHASERIVWIRNYQLLSPKGG